MNAHGPSSSPSLTDMACIDHDRAKRKGFPEVVYCAGKTPEQVAAIFAQLAQAHDRLLGTRATDEHYQTAKSLCPDLQYDATARMIFRLPPPPLSPSSTGSTTSLGHEEDGLILAAGTSDLPVAKEAELTARVIGCPMRLIVDVGVAGIHRLLAHQNALQKAKVVIAVAGMEGALPSVVAGLTAAPVIAVPTSVGYGASFQGVAALLAMLNSCAPGLSVVNIDNGFGAGYLAAMILKPWRETMAKHA